MSMAFLVCAAITAISACVSLGFSLVAVPGTTGQTRTLALYACSRSTAFAVLSTVPFLNASVPWLRVVAIGMILVQAGDAGIGLNNGDRLKTFGPAGTAIANLGALIWLIHG